MNMERLSSTDLQCRKLDQNSMEIRTQLAFDAPGQEERIDIAVVVRDAPGLPLRDVHRAAWLRARELIDAVLSRDE